MSQYRNSTGRVAERCARGAPVTVRSVRSRRMLPLTGRKAPRALALAIHAAMREPTSAVFLLFLMCECLETLASVVCHAASPGFPSRLPRCLQSTAVAARWTRQMKGTRCGVEPSAVRCFVLPVFLCFRRDDRRPTHRATNETDGRALPDRLCNLRRPTH